MRKWVRSKYSEDAKKYEVEDIPFYRDDVWIGTAANGWHLHLPKDEFVECEAPVLWEDVTTDCCVVTGNFIKHVDDGEGRGILMNDGYNLRKVQLRTLDSHPTLGHQRRWAFVVDRKKED